MFKSVIRELGVGAVSIIVIVIAVGVLYNSAIWAHDSMYKALVTDNKVEVVDVNISIPQGSSTETIANILKENELIGSVFTFRMMAKLNGFDSKFQYGDFSLSTGMGDEEIMKRLATEGEKRATLKFTIPEGYTVEQIGKKLAKENICSYSEFLAAVEDADSYGYDFIQYIPKREQLRLQGYLFPATYEIYEGATAKEIVSKMLAKFDQVFKEEYYAKLDMLGITFDEAIAMASIIEREVRVPEERPMVAGVIYNRLEIHMNLEMCSTVMYALGKTRSRLSYADLEIDSPYNTYRNPGLPIGPIANPGEEAIKAVFNPTDHDYLFFVLVDDEVGKHEFNTTLGGHEAAKARYNQKF